MNIHIERGYIMNDIITMNNRNLATAPQFTDGLFNKFIAYLDASPKTIETYTRALKQFAKWTAENNITQPTREDIIAYREYLKEDHKPSTIQNYIIATRLFFKWTDQEGLYPNVAEHIKGAKLDREHKKDYLTPSQVKKILAKIDRSTVQGLRDYAIIALMITGGLRTIEVSRANIEDLTIMGDRSILYVQGKGHNERAEYINISPEVEDAIRDYLKARKETDGKQPLFTSLSNNSKGDRMTTRSISRLVKNAFINAGYNSEKLTAHSTRHTAVTLALMGGESLEVVQQFARHANITTTQIYAHNLERANNKCSAVIAKAIF